MKTPLPRVTIGAPSDGGPEFALQIWPKRLDDLFGVRLPGVVYQVGQQRLLAILPVVAVATTAGDRTRVAMVTFAETNPTATDAALETFLPVLKKHRPAQFHIQVEGQGFTYRDLLESHQTGRLTRESPGTVALRVRLSIENRKSPLVSAPFPGVGVVTSSPSDPGPGGNSGETEGRHFWDCHSHWYTMAWPFPFGRYTLCHGPCAVGTCHCNAQGGACPGWCTCTC